MNAQSGKVLPKKKKKRVRKKKKDILTILDCSLIEDFKAYILVRTNELVTYNGSHIKVHLILKLARLFHH